MRVTACQCEQAGWCERHQCEKDVMFWKLCRRSPPLFLAWERGKSPGQMDTHRHHGRCQHQGSVLREEECPSCRGPVRLKLFACALHGECTPTKQLEKIACCAHCSDFVNADDGQETQ